MEKTARASKKQRELLLFIDGFIKGNNYAPSYREIMRALGYKSVSTVAAHVDGLIVKGYLRKTDHSARSVEVVSLDMASLPSTGTHQRWLRDEVRRRIEAGLPDEQVQVLRAALVILEIDPDPQAPRVA